MRHSMKPDLRADYKIRLYTRPKNPFFEVSSCTPSTDEDPSPDVSLPENLSLVKHQDG